ncbi:hypothetical protein FAM22021_001002 [Propionibacterium freudenreichii]|nr:hypothetical protein [Propionibacterium freudenreichii]
MAQLSIELGTSREVAEAGRQAHAITKWLGPNAPSLEHTAGRLQGRWFGMAAGLQRWPVELCLSAGGVAGGVGFPAGRP